MSDSNNSQALDSSIIALVSLASGIAAKHPDMGLCQLDKLRHMGFAESHIQTVIEIARHIRDEASQKLDFAFDEKSDTGVTYKAIQKEEESSSCCSTTASGQSCC